MESESKSERRRIKDITAMKRIGRGHRGKGGDVSEGKANKTGGPGLVHGRAGSRDAHGQAQHIEKKNCLFTIYCL